MATYTIFQISILILSAEAAWDLGHIYNRDLVLRAPPVTLRVLLGLMLVRVAFAVYVVGYNFGLYRPFLNTTLLASLQTFVWLLLIRFYILRVKLYAQR